MRLVLQTGLNTSPQVQADDLGFLKSMTSTGSAADNLTWDVTTGRDTRASTLHQAGELTLALAENNYTLIFHIYFGYSLEIRVRKQL